MKLSQKLIKTSKKKPFWKKDKFWNDFWIVCSVLFLLFYCFLVFKCYEAEAEEKTKKQENWELQQIELARMTGRCEALEQGNKKLLNSLEKAKAKLFAVERTKSELETELILFRQRTFSNYHYPETEN